ncbi:hypothetical protein BCR37DRAFT_377525 [Protomyces lactucae-debilis]|uniref:Uncharacterized protein n=1 Tax=Protomyces lactucae-debilis TaxID=2754530 RepID=A0A1Y2FLB8_PROLT|nr:uncharacterized protein BCR37DRAFT_377525 [Protomyces lactucae-debilis]ORY84770.1 hypothetical protein BCR37DRAFT_377525 [Protomyces lactucae-debilis]
MLRFNSGGRFKPGLLLAFVLLFSLLSSLTLNSGLVAAGRTKGSKNKAKVATGEDPWLSGSKDTKQDKAVAPKKGPSKCYSMKMSIMNTMKEQVSDLQDCRKICQDYINDWRTDLGRLMSGRMHCLQELPCVNGWSVSTDFESSHVRFGLSNMACQLPECRLPCTCLVQSVFYRIRQPSKFGTYATIPREVMFGDPLTHYLALEHVANEGGNLACIPKFLFPKLFGAEGFDSIVNTRPTWHRQALPEFSVELDLDCNPTHAVSTCECIGTREVGENCQASGDRQGAHDAGQSSHEPGRDAGRNFPFDLNELAPENDQSYQRMADHFDEIRESEAYNQQFRTEIRTAFDAEINLNAQPGDPYAYPSNYFQPMQQLQYSPRPGHPAHFDNVAHFDSHMHMGGYENDPQTNYGEYWRQDQYTGGNDDSSRPADGQQGLDLNQIPPCYDTPDGNRNCGYM